MHICAELHHTSHHSPAKIGVLLQADNFAGRGGDFNEQVEPMISMTSSFFCQVL